MVGKKPLIRGSAFVSSAQGMSVEFWLHDDGHVSAECRLSASQEGPPQHAHGGALASLIDEAMGAAAWAAGYRVVAVHLDFDYFRAVPLGASISIRGQVESVDGRKVFTSGAVVLNGETAVKGKGVFVEAPQFFDQPGFQVVEERDD
jgi:acyl-coenzyme A thioesterase PaaI-like protein